MLLRIGIGIRRDVYMKKQPLLFAAAVFWAKLSGSPGLGSRIIYPMARWYSLSISAAMVSWSRETMDSVTVKSLPWN